METTCLERLGYGRRRRTENAKRRGGPAARQPTKTHAPWGGITPRWLVNFLSWTPVEAGIFRLNRVTEQGVRLVGAPRERAGVVSFVIDGCRTEDVGKGLTAKGSRCAPAITVRSRFCAVSGSKVGSSFLRSLQHS